MRAKFEEWLADGESWIGIFENHDFGSGDLGRRVAFVYDDSVFDKALATGDISRSELDDLPPATPMRAPDHAEIGLGWRYLLIAKVRDADEAVTIMEAGPMG